MKGPIAKPRSLSDSLEEIQGNVLRGYATLPYGAFLFVRIDGGHSDQVRSWLRELLDGVTTAAHGKPEQKALNLAFTFPGLRTIGVPEDLLARFDNDFREGMGAARAQAKIGDSGASAPALWEKGFRDAAEDAAGHVLLVLRGVCEESRDEHLDALKRGVAAHAALEIVYEETSDPIGTSGEDMQRVREHFGFADGLSQPEIAGAPGERRTSLKEWSGAPEGVDGGHGVRPGEFLLGYTDEDGQKARPDSRFHANGSFMVFRKLQQNVAAFRTAVADNARALLVADGLSPTRDEVERREQWVAAKILGRWASGASLMSHPAEPPLQDDDADNDFGYLQDADGFRCPLGAHIRRTNPRDALEGGVDRAKRHRIMRRGMPYGNKWSPGDPDDDSRGLLFICFNASIARQFEVVQTWCVDGNLFDVPDEADFILDPSDGPESVMTVQGKPPRFLTRAEPLVVTKGGAYLFYPSLPALAAIASGQYDGLNEPANLQMSSPTTGR